MNEFNRNIFNTISEFDKYLKTAEADYGQYDPYGNPVNASNENRKLLVIGGDNEFLVKSVVNEARSRGYECTVCPPYARAVKEQGQDINVYLLFIDSAELLKDLLTFLNDTAYDKRTELGFVGERLDLQETMKYIGKEHVGKFFERPIDAKQICRGINELYEMADKRIERKRILIVDDDPVSLKKTQAILQKQYKIYTARSAFSAVKVLDKHKIDLILLDYIMPVIDGPKFLTALRLEPETETVPVIFLSGRTDTQAIIDAMTLGSETYISKELNAQKLVTAISDYFAKIDYANQVRG